MQIKGFSAILFLILNFFISLSGFSQKLITGRVLNIISKLPVENVAVSVFKGTKTTTTNAIGYFQLIITEEDSLVFTHPDYKSGGLKPPDAEVFIVYIEQYNYYPSYEAGEWELYEYLEKELKYPRKAFSRGLEGILFIEVQIDPEGNMIDCRSVNELCKNCQEKIIEVFEKIPGQWSGWDEPLVKRLIFPIVFKMSSFSQIIPDSDYKLPEGKVMPKIVLTARAFKAP